MGVPSAMHKFIRRHTPHASGILARLRPAVHPPECLPRSIGKPFDDQISTGTNSNRSPVQTQVVYPSFCFEIFLNPGRSGTSISPRSDGESDTNDDDPSVVRADSVKKKRKRKMNKHKLRKLRKRLRRKT
ncbi:hypothetical protein M569_13883 [Genlisea aurea]|uniref:Small ribosomal subunit protein mS38 n=1 Tax=Genlisea aurea TaxID=192259 RepID=S8C2M6_9LAMI|nr:hypothetical protein M569_13883 [Genlisea aurea]